MACIPKPPFSSHRHCRPRTTMDRPLNLGSRMFLSRPQGNCTLREGNRTLVTLSTWATTGAPNYGAGSPHSPTPSLPGPCWPPPRARPPHLQGLATPGSLVISPRAPADKTLKPEACITAQRGKLLLCIFILYALLACVHSNS